MNGDAFAAGSSNAFGLSVWVALNLFRRLYEINCRKEETNLKNVILFSTPT
jgi:hypothetical protein